MKKLVCGSLLSILCLATPQAIFGQKNTEGNVVKIVTDLDHQWLAHARAHQTEYLQELFTNDFIEILDGGQVLTKAQLIASIAAKNTRMTHLDAEDIKVIQAASNLVLLTDRTTLKGLFNGKDITSQYRVFRIFIKQNNGWHAAGASLTRIPPDTN